MDPETFAILLTAALAAGWVDAVVGGGGLLLLPALLVAFPNAPAATMLGTNKLAAIFGTCSAAVTYARRLKPDRQVLLPTTALALLGAGGGAALAGAISSDALRPVIMAVLFIVAVVVLLRPGLGLAADPGLRTPARLVLVVAVAGAGIGFYDGLIGPGTGTFLLMALTGILGMDFVSASAAAKIVNTATNLGALLVFAITGHVLWLLGLGLAVCTVLGAQLGSRMALRRGSGFVRIVLLIVVAALLLRLGYEQFG